MDYISRNLTQIFDVSLKRGKSILLLGPRQTGKTTLMQQFQTNLSITFARPDIRQRYEKNPSLIIGEVEALAEQNPKKPLILIDEVQKVPEILDSVQYLIDNKTAQFILTGSSARKLRHNTKINWLPGRVVVLRLDPLTYTEIKSYEPVLLDLLLYGTLPGIFKEPESNNKDTDLQSYVSTYLEEEIRAEALVRNIGIFSRFLELAACESGSLVNFRKLSQEIGVAHTTIASYYQILEDCLIIERIEPYLETKTRRILTKTPKHLFFDLGLRRMCANEGKQLPKEYLGHLFEQWVGLELIRNSRLSAKPYKVHFWRDKNGMEVDWLIKLENELIPIEVKWTDKPSLNDAKHLLVFKQEYPLVKNSYIICQVPRKIKLADHVYAIPWQEIGGIVDS